MANFVKKTVKTASVFAYIANTDVFPAKFELVGVIDFCPAKSDRAMKRAARERFGKDIIPQVKYGEPITYKMDIETFVSKAVIVDPSELDDESYDESDDE